MRVYPTAIKSDSEMGWLDLMGLGVESEPAGSWGVVNYTVLQGQHKTKLRCLYLHVLMSMTVNKNLEKALFKPDGHFLAES